MKTGEFLNRLERESQVVSSREEAEELARSVLSTLHDRLTPNEADHVEAQLPQGLKELWNDGFFSKVAHRAGGVDKLSFDEFVDRVAEDTGYDRDRAERATLNTLHLLKQQISQGEAEDVESQLPKDFQRAWRSA